MQLSRRERFPWRSENIFEDGNKYFCRSIDNNPKMNKFQLLMSLFWERWAGAQCREQGGRGHRLEDLKMGCMHHCYIFDRKMASNLIIRSFLFSHEHVKVSQSASVCHDALKTNLNSLQNWWGLDWTHGHTDLDSGNVLWVQSHSLIPLCSKERTYWPSDRTPCKTEQASAGHMLLR